MARPQLVKTFKIIAFVFGGIAAVIALLAATISLLFDAQAVKSQAARVMLEKKQRILKIEGEASLSFWPGLGLKLGKVSLSEHGSEQLFAKAEKARLTLRLLPLLKKEIAVDTVELDGISVNLVHRKDGSFNFDDFLSPDKDKEPMRFDVAGVHLTNGSLSYADEGPGRTLQISALDLTSGRLANASQGRLTISGKLAVNQPSLTGNLKLLANYRFDLDKKSYALDGVDIRTGGEYLGMKDAELAFSADLLSATPEGVEVMKLELGAKGKTPQEELALKLSAPKFVLGADKSSSEPLTFNASATGPNKKAGVHAEVSGITLDTKQFQARKFLVTAENQETGQAMRFSLSSPLSYDFAGQVLKVPGLAGEFSLSHPALANALKGAINGALELDAAKPTLSASLNGELDGSHLSAKVNLSRFSPLAVGFTVNVDHLNMDQYLAPAKTPAKGAPPVAEAKPLDFSFLNDLNLDGTVKAGALQYSGIKLANLNLDIRAKNGRLDVSPLAANLYQGSTSGSLSVESKDNRVVLRQNLVGVAVGALLKDATKKDMLEGKGNLVLDLTASGKDAPAMTRALAGTAKLSLKDGAIKGINLAKSLRDLKGRLLQKQNSDVAANAADKTDFTEMSASFDVDHGIAKNKDLSAKSPFLRLTGAGQFDLGKETMDYLAKVTVVGSAAGQEGKDLADLKGLTIPVRLTGTFQAPSYRLAFADMLSDVVAGKAKAAVSDVKENAKAKAGDALKGLLGR